MENCEVVKEFLEKLDKLCFDYNCEIHPSKECDTLIILYKDEIIKVRYIDGDGLD